MQPDRPRRMWIALAGGALALCTAAGDCRPSADIISPECEGLCIEVLETVPRSPFVVSFDLRLRDRDGTIKDGVTAQHFQITEGTVPLDLTESNQFVNSGDSLPLKIMLVLDYTNSMAQSFQQVACLDEDDNPTGEVCTGPNNLDEMIRAAKAFVKPSPFDDGDELGVIQIRDGGSGSENMVIDALQQTSCVTPQSFLAETFGDRRNPTENVIGIWDAVSEGINMVKDEEGYKAVVFVTDGDEALPTPSFSDGENQGVRLFPVAFGAASTARATLKTMADATDGQMLTVEYDEDDRPLFTELFDDLDEILRNLGEVLNVVVVLDYTNESVNDGDAAALVEAAQQFFNPPEFSGTQRIGVVEFHDRTAEGFGYSEVIGLTAADCIGRQAITREIPSRESVESGQTRLWDAVNLAMDTLVLPPVEDHQRLAVVFLTDGRDTTSTASAREIRLRSRDSNIAMYAIDFGADSDDTLIEELREVALTGLGRYFPARDASDLRRVFREIAEDLRGQWNLTYITQRNFGPVNVKVDFTWDDNGIPNSETFLQSFDASAINGKIHEGILEVYDRVEENGWTHFKLRASYIPRSIREFKFVLPPDACLQLQDRGGLTSPSNGWCVISGEDGSRHIIRGLDNRRDDDATTDNATDDSEDAVCPTLQSTPGCDIERGRVAEFLQYGSFGNIATISLPGEITNLSIEHNDDIYLDLPQDKNMRFATEQDPLQNLSMCITRSAGGSVDISPDKELYERGETVTLTARPNPLFEFEGWRTGGAGEPIPDLSIDIIFNDNIQIEPVFRSSGQVIGALTAEAAADAQDDPTTRQRQGGQVQPDDFCGAGSGETCIFAAASLLMLTFVRGARRRGYSASER